MLTFNKATRNYVFIIFLVILLITQLDTIKVNAIVFMTLRRGIITQNCFWWRVNDYFPDSTGYELYQRLKQKERFVKLNILGKDIYLLTKLNDIQELLDSSPNPFGAGILKKSYFSSFMSRNVGISDGLEWVKRREYNDIILETDKPHSLTPIFTEYINEIFSTIKPKDFSEFTQATRQITSKIIFGTYEYNDIIYKIFKQADSLLSATFSMNFINKQDLAEYEEYLRKELHNSRPNTLLSLGHQYHKMLPQQDLIEQIPHFIFPIAGLFSVHFPRLLVLLLNHPKEYEIVKEQIQHNQHFHRENHIRKCILELFRLNNAVNSTFRGLLEPYQFTDSNVEFEKGTEFVFFNNPVLRDLFERPNEFVPSRWDAKLENEYRALMFNQANQRCPGKELVLSLLQSACVQYLKLCDFKVNTNIKLNPEYIPYLINPCTITFYW